MRKLLYVASVSLVLATQMSLAPPASAAKSTSARIRELQQIIAEQERRLEEQARILGSLQQQMIELNATTEEIIEKAVPPDEKPRVARSGNDKVKLTVSGQVNRALLFTNDGETNDLFNVDNDNSSTRVRFVGLAKPGGDLTIGSNFEVEFQSNASNDVNQNDKRQASSNNFKRRKLELYFDHTQFGRLWLGHGDTASNGIAEVDLSGTSLIGYSSIADMAGGMLFRIDGDVPVFDGNGNLVSVKDTPLSTIEIGDNFSNLDGLSRDDRIRYDTPSFAGFKASGSWVTDGRWDVALRYGGEFGGFKAAAGIAYFDKQEDNLSGIVAGSFSVLHQSGFNLTFASGREDRDSDDPNYWYLKLGYKTDNIIPWGETAFGIDYTQSKDFLNVDGNFNNIDGDPFISSDEGKSYGIFAVQDLDDFATELYFGVRNHELDANGSGSFEDILAVMAGARIKF